MEGQHTGKIVAEQELLINGKLFKELITKKIWDDGREIDDGLGRHCFIITMERSIDAKSFKMTMVSDTNDRHEQPPLFETLMSFDELCQFRCLWTEEWTLRGVGTVSDALSCHPLESKFQNTMDRYADQMQVQNSFRAMHRTQ